jgi:hypothetical protein
MASKLFDDEPFDRVVIGEATLQYKGAPVDGARVIRGYKDQDGWATSRVIGWLMPTIGD